MAEPPSSASVGAPASPTLRDLALAALLALAVLAIYAQVRHHEFVEFDDPLYVTENARVQQGFTVSNLVWSFTSRDAFLFHPLTWWSYMLDVELWGSERAGPFALTNALLHALTAMLLFAWLRSLTGRSGASALAVALFALHPLRVESVAWVSERKDVLSGLLLVLTLWAWVGYARRGGTKRYAAAAGLLLAGLLAKSILVVVPVLLLLLDAWPLRRLGRVPLSRLVLEKLPLLALSLAVTAIGIALMGQAESVWGADPPLGRRIAGAGVAAVFYLGKILWPLDLAVLYPDPVQQGLPDWSAAQVAGAFALLAGISAAALANARRRPALAVGWLWYLVALGPVLGLVPFGVRVMNDRHTYLPMIGLSIAVVFGLGAWLPPGRAPRRAAAALGVAAVLACAVLSYRQVGVWRDSLTLFDHALAVTQRNALVHGSKAVALAKRGESAAAKRELEAALAIHPGYADAHNNLGYLLQQEGDLDGAARHYERALALRPGYARALVNLGGVLAARGETEAALARLEEAVASAPDYAAARFRLGQLLERLGRGPEATAAYRAAVERAPAEAWAQAALARRLEAEGALAEALASYRAVLAADPDDRAALRGAAWIQAAAPDPALRDAEASLRLAERLDELTEGRSAPARYTLAAALAEAGRFEAAAAALREALERLTPGERRWGPELRRCLALYEAGRPYRPPARG